MLAPVQAFVNRLTGKRLWVGHEKTLRQKDLFILPNRYGVYVAFLVFASFAIGYRVQNNFILLGVIFLFLIYMLSLIASVRNLQGLSFSFRTAPYYMASETQQVMLSLQRTDPVYNLNSTSTSEKLVLNLAKSQAEIRPIVGNLPRGIHTVPALKVQTCFPFGIVRCWSWLSPSITMTVCPTPDMRPPTEYPRTTQTPVTEGSEIYSPPQQHYQKTGFCRIREHLRMVICPHALIETLCGNPGIIDPDFSAPNNGDVVLQASTDMEKEAALSYLCGGVLVCANHQENAIMILNNQRFTIQNDSQRLEALHALASA